MTPNGKSRYLAETVATASPARLVVMLYDRLALDIVQGGDALRAGQYRDANELLQHAQSIVLELRASLDIDKWDGGARLASIYGWLLKQLVLANVNKDAELADHCRELVEPLREAWHAAAAKLMARAG